MFLLTHGSFVRGNFAVHVLATNVGVWVAHADRDRRVLVSIWTNQGIQFPTASAVMSMLSAIVGKLACQATTRLNCTAERRDMFFPKGSRCRLKSKLWVTDKHVDKISAFFFFSSPLVCRVSSLRSICAELIQVLRSARW